MALSSCHLLKHFYYMLNVLYLVNTICTNVYNIVYGKYLYDIFKHGVQKPYPSMKVDNFIVGS